jgi:hypothetical protein
VMCASEQICTHTDTEEPFAAKYRSAFRVCRPVLGGMSDPFAESVA